jgi:glycosyltransferase involved in cell wall biosynthesis
MEHYNYPLRVVQIVLSLSIGGTEKIVYDLVRFMNGPNVCPHVLCLDEVGEFGEMLNKQHGIPVERLDRSPGLDRKLVSRLAKRITEISPHIVHAHHYSPFFYGLFATLAARRRIRRNPPRILMTEHGIEYPFRKKWKRCVVNPILLRMADAITTIAFDTRKNLTRYENYPSSKIQVLYNGIDLEAFFTSASPEAARRSLGISPDTPTIGVVARLDPVKNHSMLFLAFHKVRERFPSAILFVIGDGPDRKRLESVARELGEIQAIRFLGARRDVAHIIRALDVFALPSFSEGMSVTLLEAMAAEIPVVATRVGGNEEVVVDGETGFLVPNDNAMDMAERLMELLGEEDLRREMGLAGRNRAVSVFSIQQMVTQYLTLYERMLSRRPASII